MANDNGSSDRQKIEELTAIIQTVRDRVRSRYPEALDGLPESEDEYPKIRVAIADLMPLVHARDAAQARIAAIGSVNPRPGGLLNKLIQFLKKTLARSLQWFVRDQVTFNSETVSAIEAVMEALNEHNRILISLAAQTNERVAAVRSELSTRVRELSLQIDARAAELSRQTDARAADLNASFAAHNRELAHVLESRIAGLSNSVDGLLNESVGLKSEAAELKDIRKHWIEWRADWERKVAVNEIQFLRNAADIQGAFQHRVGIMEGNFRDTVKGQHKEYLAALDRTTLDIQKRMWDDLEKVRIEYERLIHNELRIIRQRALLHPEPAVSTLTPPHIPDQPDFDYGRFAERFRGDEEYVRKNLELYLPYFRNCTNVLDIGCGRGEFLEAMKEAAVPARGIDLGEESVAQCRSKGLTAEVADLFTFLPQQPDSEFDGIFCSQVVEHLPPSRLAEMVRLCGAKLRRGGVLAIETPNPECLAIFATHFYLDPTHTRPVPHQLLAFYMEESGLGLIEVHRLAPAIETIPEVASLPEDFRNRFFGGLDFAIIGRRL